ncbi:TetR/AcrR family transcriptional regulator [Herbiconiux sp. YIM B11900]|uniref:TetR/AcrR family transcriptional regulator n=1 Tax=Herbiconiux sp. YIM B11900 TaxID=3404131 RepID=UPI003F82D058
MHTQVHTTRPAKRGRPTADDRDRRRTRILDAAVGSFGDRGFAGSSLDEIAATAGVTKRTIYTDYGDKAAVFDAAVEREHDRIRAIAGEGATLQQVAAELVFVLHSDAAIALHRSVIAEAPRFPELARRFYAAGPGHSIALLARHLTAPDATDAAGTDREPAASAALPRAEALYALLLGERHRRRLLALDPAPTAADAAAHAASCLAVLGRG